MTKILIKTPYFGDRPYEISSIQPLIPYKIIGITQGSFQFIIEIEQNVTKAEVDTIISQLKSYVIANLITGEIIS